MSFLAAVAVTGAVIGGVGLYENYKGQQQVAAGQQALLQNQIQQQDLQQQQNVVNATRQQRQMIREGIVARANAESNATNSGSQLGSGLEGALSQDSAQVADNVGAVGQNTAFGQAALSIKNKMIQNQMTIAAGGATAALGSGLESLGGGLMKNAGTITQVGLTIKDKLFS